MLNKIALLPKASALVEEATQQSNIHEDTKYARTIELWFNQLSVTLLLAPSCTLCVSLLLLLLNASTHSTTFCDSLNFC